MFYSGNTGTTSFCEAITEFAKVAMKLGTARGIVPHLERDGPKDGQSLLPVTARDIIHVTLETSYFYTFRRTTKNVKADK